MKPCYGKCSRCVWYRNGGCSEWAFYNRQQIYERKLLNKRGGELISMV